MTAKFPKELDFSLRRPRLLEPSQGNQRSAEDPMTIKKNRQYYTDATTSTYRRVSDKANIIINAAAEVAKKYSIPVVEESSEIRAAVNRQDPGSNEGSVISFDLFVRMLDIVEGMAERVDYDIIDDRVIGDPAANQRTIRKKLDSRFDDDNDGLLALLLVGGQIMTLYMIHLINGTWRGPEKVAASPTEPAAFIEGLREMTVGLAASTLIAGVNSHLAALFTEQGNYDTNTKTLVSGALADYRQTELPPIVQRANVILGIDDHKIILKYAIKYIAETQDRGYEFWFAYMTARRTRFLSSRSLRSAPMFSEVEFAKNNYSIDESPGSSFDEIPQNVLLNQIGPNSLLGNLASELQNGLNNSIVTPTDEFLCAQDYESNGFEKGLNFLAQVLDTRLSRDVLCCLVRFLSNVDTDLLNKIRAVLGIFLNTNTIHLAATLENFTPFLVNWVRDTFMKLIMELVQTILDKIYRVINDFLFDIEGDLGALEGCPLIIELIQSILDALDIIIQDVEELVKNYTLQIELNLSTHFGLTDDIEVAGARGGLIKVHKKRSLRRLLAIIDGIIGVLDSGFVLCDSEEADQYDQANGPRIVTYDEILDSPGILDLEDYLDIPSDVKNKYFSDAYEVRLPDGTILPNYEVGELQIGTVETDTQAECHREFPEEFIRDAVARHKERVN